MQSFVAPKGELGQVDTAGHGSNGFGPTAFLKSIKGIKPLALDLSWRFVCFLQPISSTRILSLPTYVSHTSQTIQFRKNGPDG